jgi:hypothetical protein
MALPLKEIAIKIFADIPANANMRGFMNQGPTTIAIADIVGDHP